MENLELYNKVREVPKDAQRAITAGRLKGFTDINPMWRIKCLTEQFGPCGLGWYYKTVEKWIETVGDEICVFVAIELYVKYESMYLMSVIKWQLRMHCQWHARILALGQMFTGKKAIPSMIRQTTVLPKCQVLIYLDSDHT